MRPHEIIDCVLAASRVTQGELLGSGRTAPIVAARCAAVYLLRKHTALAYTDIALLTRGRRRAHNTCIYQYRRMVTDPANPAWAIVRAVGIPPYENGK